MERQSRQRFTPPPRLGSRPVLGIIVVILFLSACTAPLDVSRDAPRAAGSDRASFVQTVWLQGSETIEQVETATGGEVYVWRPGEFALVGLAALPEPLAEFDLLARGIEANTSSFGAGGKLAEMNGKSMIWSGGKSMIWSGGKSMVWSGGKSMIWSGGEFAWMPENTASWLQIGLDEAHSTAPSLGYGVIVAIIDTGVDMAHPALAEALAPSEDLWDFVGGDPQPQEEGEYGDPGYGHGTNVDQRMYRDKLSRKSGTTPLQPVAGPGSANG